MQYFDTSFSFEYKVRYTFFQFFFYIYSYSIFFHESARPKSLVDS